MIFFYNIFTSLYLFSVYIVSFFNKKAKKWIEGRKNVFENLNAALAGKQAESLLWMHCASLGEFEQGRPLLEKLKEGNSKLKIVLTFFSPSGYEIRKNSPLADHIFYLPMDSKKNAERFVSLLNPSVVIFVKYEFWFHYLNELKKKNIPSFLISASFRANQHFFRWYGEWFREILKTFTHIFVQDEGSKNLLEKINIKNVSVSGDTRFDRVFATAQAAEGIPVIAKFKEGKKIFIAGSTWEEDEKIIYRIPFSKYRLKVIIAPHEISENNIRRVISLFPEKSIRYSHLLKMDEATRDRELIACNFLIIDNIGMLARLYRYGDISYIGGAHGRSLHNILEAAAFGLPVIFGPDYSKNWEAAALIGKGGAFSVKNSGELENKIGFLLHDEMILRIASEMSRNFVRSNTGATEKILESIRTSLNN